MNLEKMAEYIKSNWQYQGVEDNGVIKPNVMIRHTLSGEETEESVAHTLLNGLGTVAEKSGCEYPVFVEINDAPIHPAEEIHFVNDFVYLYKLNGMVYLRGVIDMPQPTTITYTANINPNDDRVVVERL